VKTGSHSPKAPKKAKSAKSKRLWGRH
jgi:hypothetical protein